MPITLLHKRHREVNRVVMLPLAEIHRNPSQPRRQFDPETLTELARSIIANGLLQPVTVRKLETGGYELIAGERRTLAFLSLGREQIPAIVEDCTDEQSAVLALIENLQRAELNCFDEALAIARLMEQLGLTQQQVSQRLGKAQSTVANKLRLLRYPPELQETMLAAGLTERHARALLKVKPPVPLEEAVGYVIAHRLNVEQTEQYVESLVAPIAKEAPIRRYLIKDMRIFKNTIQKAVRMMNAAGVEVTCHCSEDDANIEYRIHVPKNSVIQQNSLP